MQPDHMGSLYIPLYMIRFLHHFSDEGRNIYFLKGKASFPTVHIGSCCLINQRPSVFQRNFYFDSPTLKGNTLSVIITKFTLPETNSSLYVKPSQKETNLPTIHFQGRTVSFREGKPNYTSWCTFERSKTLETFSTEFSHLQINHQEAQIQMEL